MTGRPKVQEKLIYSLFFLKSCLISSVIFLKSRFQIKKFKSSNRFEIYFYVSAVLTERHPITNAIDGKNTWWQSPSIQNGIEYHYVTITLDLQQVDFCLFVSGLAFWACFLA